MNINKSFSRHSLLRFLLPTCYQETLGITTSVISGRPLEQEEATVTDQQIKRWALQAYDRPGQCFYVSLALLR